MDQARESMAYDVVIVGAGPAGLSAAIRLKQLAQASGQTLSVCILEKAAEPGGHILSGAVIDPIALKELFPDWADRGAPLHIPVCDDRFLFLSKGQGFSVPQWLVPPCFKNHGHYVARLSDLVKWLSQEAEALGVEVFPGFAAAEILFDDRGSVRGVATGAMGIDRQGHPGPHAQPGVELHARYTLFAEGSRGHLGRQLIDRYQLDAGRDPQAYGIGLKEVWQIEPRHHQAGRVIHTAGWPLDRGTYGGSFIYHLDHHQIAIGYVVGLDYENPWLSPFEEFQRFKTHPEIRRMLEGGKRLSYGARALTVGGINSLPRLVFPGGALLGCEAGFLNASRIKGSHGAMKSGMLCAEAIHEAYQDGSLPSLLDGYTDRFEKSWLKEELHRGRNFKPAMAQGLWLGSLLVAIDQILFRGRAPFTLHKKKPDHACLKPAQDCPEIQYPKPDGQVSFDRSSSVFLSGTAHEENQPNHLTLKNNLVPVQVNLTKYAGPEARYCPAGVYEYLDAQGQPTHQPSEGARLQINAQNCVHCKTCDIKDPAQNIVWVCPEGGGGPNYLGM
jgi:electron-transferring-flavoprotein dehydrogenase